MTLNTVIGVLDKWLWIYIMFFFLFNDSCSVSLIYHVLCLSTCYILFLINGFNI